MQLLLLWGSEAAGIDVVVSKGRARKQNFRHPWDIRGRSCCGASRHPVGPVFYMRPLVHLFHLVCLFMVFEMGFFVFTTWHHVFHADSVAQYITVGASSQGSLFGYL